MIKINKNPVPKKKLLANRGLPRKYPYAELEVGENFFVPHKNSADLCPGNSYHGKTLGRKFTCQKGEDKETGISGVYVKRVA